MSTQASFAQRVELAQETRKRFVVDASRAMVALGSAVQERLTGLMNEAAPSREMQTRRDIWMLYQRQQSAWVEGTLKDWQTALQPPVAPASIPPKSLDGSFELVGTEVVENKIIASRLVLGVMENISVEFNDLRVRIKFLQRTDDLEGYDILRPDVLLLLMIERWASAGMPHESWPMVNDLVLKSLSAQLKQAYASANEFLIKQGVLPTTELMERVKRIASPTPRASSLRVPAAAQLPTERSAGPDTGHVSHDANHENQSGSAKRSLGGQTRAPRSGYGGAADETRMMTAISPLARARNRAQGVLGQLKRLLMGPDESALDATHYQPPSPALAAAIALRPAPGTHYADDIDLEDYSPAGVARVAVELRQQITELKKKAETPSEKATIEIVALMFQSILQEDRIPPGIRVWFARLQMPVLRVALAEPDFFGTLDHPARQLIDRMGSCVMGFDASGIHGSTLEQEIKRVVQVIEQYPETGRRVYQLVYDEFQKFLAQFLTGNVATQKLVSVAQLVEEKATLTIQYTIEMRNILKDMPVRDEIREFLFKIWAEVLAVAAVRKGPQHAETLGFKKAATDLVWAASAKPNRSDRARVIKDLPQLLHKLRAGMALLGMAPSEQEAHIKAVSDTFADAFMSKTQSISPEQIQTMALRLANLEEAVIEDGMGDLPLDAQSIEMMLGLDAATIDVVADGGSKPTAAMQAWAQELELGSWFTLDHNGRVAQVQFVWRSERKHLNLFAATTGHSYLLQAGRLAAYLQAGLLLPQEEETLTVRATRDALIKLDANPERLLS